MGHSNSKTKTLAKAIEEGDMTTVESIVEADPCRFLDAMYSGGETLMHLAVSAGDPTLIRYLVNKGACANEVNASGWFTLSSAILHATTSREFDVIELLLRQGASRVNPDTMSRAMDLEYRSEESILQLAVVISEHASSLALKGRLLCEMVQHCPSLLVRCLEHGTDPSGLSQRGVKVRKLWEIAQKHSYLPSLEIITLNNATPFLKAANNLNAVELIVNTITGDEAKSRDPHDVPDCILDELSNIMRLAIATGLPLTGRYLEWTESMLPSLASLYKKEKINAFSLQVLARNCIRFNVRKNNIFSVSLLTHSKLLQEYILLGQ